MLQTASNLPKPCEKLEWLSGNPYQQLAHGVRMYYIICVMFSANIVIFLWSDAVAIFFAVRFVQLLFKVAFISLESPQISTLDKVHTNATVTMLESVSSAHSLSVLLSAVETIRTAQTVLALVWWLSSEIIHTCMRVLRLLFEGGVYSKKYGTLFFSIRCSLYMLLKCIRYSRIDKMALHFNYSNVIKIINFLMELHIIYICQTFPSGYDTKFHTQNDSANGMKTLRQILQIQQCDQNTI